jgi:hypothetical protein
MVQLIAHQLRTHVHGRRKYVYSAQPTRSQQSQAAFDADPPPGTEPVGRTGLSPRRRRRPAVTCYLMRP